MRGTVVSGFGFVRLESHAGVSLFTNPSRSGIHAACVEKHSAQTTVKQGRIQNTEEGGGIKKY